MSIIVINGVYHSNTLCLCSLCQNSPHCQAIHGLVQVCAGDGSFLKECSKFERKQGGRKYQCPCNREG